LFFLDDIAFDSYNFTVISYKNIVEINWKLSSSAYTFVISHFIKCFEYHLYMPNGSEVVENSSIPSHIFGNLASNQLYYVASKIITNDTNGWGPGLEFKQIKTKRDVGKPIMKQII